MGNKIKIAFLSVITTASLGCVAVGTLSWFAAERSLPEIDIDGSSEGAYFAYGTGTQSDPYGISNARHLNNLAWLQYNGTFNVDKDGNGEVDHFYFELANDITFAAGSEYYIPPIGTESNPFVGVFDGQNHTITGVVVTNNESEFTNKPERITYSQSEAEIVGFFGVVGRINNTSFSSATNAMKDVTLKNLTVESVTTQTLVGLAAGYVNAEMSGVTLDGTVTLNVAGNQSIADITTNISDYGLVGYTTKTSRSGTYSQKISESFDSEDGDGSGNDWGGSIAVEEMFNRLLSIKNTYTVSTNSFATEKTYKYKPGDTSYTSVEDTNTSSAPIGEYNENIRKNNLAYNSKLGAFQFGDSTNRDDIHYLSGGHFTRKNTLVQNTVYPITDGTHYLNFYLNSNDAPLTSVGTSIDDCTSWSIPQSSGRISGTLNNVTAYLTSVNNNLSITTTASEAITWTIDRSQTGKLIIKTGNYHLIYDGDFILRDFSKTSDTYYYIRDNNNHYMAPGTDQPYYLKATTSQSDACVWYYDSTNRAYFYLRDGNPRYLMYDGSRYAIANANLSNLSYYRIYQSGNYLRCSSGYVQYNNSNDNGWRIVSRQNSATTMVIDEHTITYNNVDNITDVTTTRYGPESTNDGSAANNYMDYSGQDVTYFPLNTDENYEPTNTNTGYVIGGSSYTSNNTNYGYGTVRIANFYTLSTYITNYSRATHTLSNVRSYNAEGSYIIDDNNNDFQKYGGENGSKTKVETILKKHDASNDDKVYGLHFMGDKISTSKLVTARYAQINKDVYSNYQLPASSIDFNLKERGFVNFFAGTYGNSSGSSTTTIDSFFSLHMIRRNDDHTIHSIREVKAVLSDGDQDHSYVYQLDDDSYTIPYSYNPYNQKQKYVLDTRTPLTNVYPEGVYTTQSSKPDNYDVVFDTSWIKVHNDYDQRVMYYYEIPINDGEFCLGSVEGSSFGAYLVYLDIGAFARDEDKIFAYNVTTFANSLPYPNGVDFAIVDVGVNGGESMCVYVPSGKSGTLSFGVTTSNINITDASSMATYAYKGTKFADEQATGKFTVSGNSPGELITPSVGGDRLMHIVIDSTDGSKWFIDILDHLNENGTVASTTYQSIIHDGVVMTQQDVPSSVDEYLDSIRALKNVVTLTRSSGISDFVATAEYDEETRKIVSVSIPSDQLTGTSLSVSDITSGYTIKINGRTVSNGTVYS